MSAVSQGLVPATRDFDIYREVVVRERTMREVARDYEISASRVCQLVEKVRAFLKGRAPQVTPEEQEREMYVVKQVASARVNSLYGQCVRQWEESIDRMVLTEQATRGEGPNRLVQTRRESLGDIKYLWQAVRIAERAAQLPPCDLSLYAKAEELEEAVPARKESPVGGFAPAEPKDEVAPTDTEQAAVVKAAANEICESAAAAETGSKSSAARSEQDAALDAVNAVGAALEIHRVATELAERHFPEPSPAEPFLASLPESANAKPMSKHKKQRRQLFLQQRLQEHRRHVS